MASCPFCHHEIDDGLALHGGTCPHCFADIPGEETATDPGEEVRAQLAEADRARARKRAMMPVYVGTPVVIAVLGVAIWSLWPQPEFEPLVLEESDFSIDIDLAEYTEPPPEEGGDDAVADAGGSATAGSTGGGSASPGRAPRVKAPDDGSGGGRPSSDGPPAGGSTEAPERPGGADVGSPGAAASLSFDTKRSAALLSSKEDLQNAVKDLFRSKTPRLQQCYERSLKSNESLRGQWRLSFTIQRDGTMSDVGADGIQMSDDGFEGCLEREMASWRIYGKLKKPWPVSLPINFSGY